MMKMVMLLLTLLLSMNLLATAETFYIHEDDQMVQLTKELQRDFAYVCPDTFCEGDFWNLKSLSIECLIGTKSDKIGQCLWILAGSSSEFDRSSGQFTSTTSRIYECPITTYGLTRAELLARLAGPARLGTTIFRPLSDTANESSFYDQVAKCLAH